MKVEIVAGALLLLGAAPIPEEDAVPLMKKATPVLIVEAVEPALPFWVDGLGFEKTVEVPEGDRLGFVILVGHGTEVMLQTRASLDAEVDGQGLSERMRQPVGGGVLFVEVPDLEALRARVEGFEVVVPHRRTAYGADELWVREPGGNLVGFAQFPSGE